MPKYWLDGIFDEDIVLEVVDNDFIPVPEFVGSINDFIFVDGKKGLGYYRICQSIEEVVEQEEIIVEEVQVLTEVKITPKIVLCLNFKYCDNDTCAKRHWYWKCYRERMLLRSALKFDKCGYFRPQESDSLNKCYNRYKKDGFEVSIE